MKWEDIGGRAKSQHIVVDWDYGINVEILCKQHIIKFQRVKGKRPLPHCLKCIAALKKLIQETIQLELASNYESPHHAGC